MSTMQTSFYISTMDIFVMRGMQMSFASAPGALHSLLSIPHCTCTRFGYIYIYICMYV